MRISDWSSDVCSSDLHPVGRPGGRGGSCEAEVHRRLVGAARVVRVYVDLGDRAAGIEPDPVDVEIALNVEVDEIGEVDVDRGAVLAPDAELAAVLAGMDLDLAAAFAIGIIEMSVPADLSFSSFCPQAARSSIGGLRKAGRMGG